MKKPIIYAIVTIVIVLAAIRLISNRNRIVSLNENLTADFVIVSIANVEKSRLLSTSILRERYILIRKLIYPQKPPVK